MFKIETVKFKVFKCPIMILWTIDNLKGPFETNFQGKSFNYYLIVNFIWGALGYIVVPSKNNTEMLQ